MQLNLVAYKNNMNNVIELIFSAFIFYSCNSIFFTHTHLKSLDPGPSFDDDD